MERALLAEDRHVVAAAQAAPEPTGVDKVKAEMQMLFDKTAAALTKPVLEKAAAGGTRMADRVKSLYVTSGGERAMGAVQTSWSGLDTETKGGVVLGAPSSLIVAAVAARRGAQELQERNRIEAAAKRKRAAANAAAELANMAPLDWEAKLQAIRDRSTTRLATQTTTRDE